MYKNRFYATQQNDQNDHVKLYCKKLKYMHYVADFKWRKKFGNRNTCMYLIIIPDFNTDHKQH